MKNVTAKYRIPLLAVFACLITVILLIGSPVDIFAQPGLPSSPEQTPIDGGLGILAALGGTYAIKKLREKKDV